MLGFRNGLKPFEEVVGGVPIRRTAGNALAVSLWRSFGDGIALLPGDDTFTWLTLISSAGNGFWASAGEGRETVEPRWPMIGDVPWELISDTEGIRRLSGLEGPYSSHGYPSPRSCWAMPRYIQLLLKSFFIVAQAPYLIGRFLMEGVSLELLLIFLRL